MKFQTSMEMVADLLSNSWDSTALLTNSWVAWQRTSKYSPICWWLSLAISIKASKVFTTVSSSFDYKSSKTPVMHFYLPSAIEKYHFEVEANLTNVCATISCISTFEDLVWFNMVFQICWSKCSLSHVAVKSSTIRPRHWTAAILKPSTSFWSPCWHIKPTKSSHMFIGSSMTAIAARHVQTSFMNALSFWASDPKLVNKAYLIISRVSCGNWPHFEVLKVGWPL